MGHTLFSRRVAFLAGATLLWLLSAIPAFAADQLEFVPPRDVNIRMANGSLTKAKLKSILPTSIIVSNRDGSEKELSIATVRTVSTSDNSFNYAPAQETFEKLATRAQKIQGVTLRTRAVAGSAASEKATSTADLSGDKGPNGPPAIYAAMIGLAPKALPEMSSGSAGFVTSSGFGGPNLRPHTHSALDTSAVASMTGLSNRPPAGMPGAVKPAERELVGKPGEHVYCSNPKCKKEVHDAHYGDECPYCHIIWAKEDAPAMVAVNPSGAGSETGGSSPFGAAVSATTTTPGAKTTPGAVPIVNPGFSLETVPWWGKVGGFGAMLFVLWFLSQRR
jgi:hypothetical protein